MRLACVKRAASVDSEPGSNSRLNRLFCFGQPPHLREKTDRSLQFEFKLLTKFLLLFTHDACASYATSHSTRLSNICASNPRSCEGELHAGLESRSVVFEPSFKRTARAKVQPVTGRFDYNQKIGNLKELLQKGGYRDFSRKKLSTKKLSLPRLAANPTLTTQGKTP